MFCFIVYLCLCWFPRLLCIPERSSCFIVFSLDSNGSSSCLKIHFTDITHATIIHNTKYNNTRYYRGNVIVPSCKIS